MTFLFNYTVHNHTEIWDINAIDLEKAIHKAREKMRGILSYVPYGPNDYSVKYQGFDVSSCIYKTKNINELHGMSTLFNLIY